MAPEVRSFFNQTRQTYLAAAVREARSFLSRLVGLLAGPRLEPGQGLYISPCRQIHMIGMAYPIDCVFLDKSLVVVGLVECINPGQLSQHFRAAVGCLELPAGTIAQSGTRVGDVITVSSEL